MKTSVKTVIRQGQRRFHVIKNLFGHRKARYKGLAKNTAAQSDFAGFNVPSACFTSSIRRCSSLINISSGLCQAGSFAASRSIFSMFGGVLSNTAALAINAAAI